MSIDRDAFVEVLGALPFETGRWVVAGSAPMLMAGLIESIEDVDVVVDAAAWRQAVALSDEDPREGLFGDMVVGLDVAGSSVEVFDGWLGIDADVVIAEAVAECGYPLMPLDRVVESKQRLGRPKDLRHLELMLGGRDDREQPGAGSRGPEAD